MKQNIYWDWIRGYSDWEDHNPNEDVLDLRFESVEKHFYYQQYDNYCEAQHERNRKSGHSRRNRSPDDLRLNKKTCPEESLIQIGSMDHHVGSEVLLAIAREYFAEYEARFGEHIHILDWGLHCDESTPHIHERHVFDCENEYGEIAPQQEKALEALGIPLPFPDQENTKTNNRKVMFDSICRTMLIEIAKSHGLEIQEEPQYGGREYLEKQDYILMRQKEKMAMQAQIIESKTEELDEILVRIEDTESFVEDVAETAYEKAVDTITAVIQEEVRNEDFDIIDRHRKEVLSDPKLTDRGRKFAGKIFAGLMEKFRGMTQHISDRLIAVLRRPEKKEAIKEPIRESIHDRLARSQQKADERNAARYAERGLPKKNYQQYLER